MRRAGDLITKGESGLGSLVAFESPLKRGRSVVAFTGDDADQIAALAVSMSNPKMNSHFNGDLVLQSGKRIEGFQMGPTYYVGSLPWLTAIYWFLSKQPLALIIFIGLASWLVAIVAFRFLRKMADKRLRK
jgi:cellulose synthase (UDP-forming)